LGKKKKRPFLQLLLFFNSGNELRYCTTKENPEDTNHPGLEVKGRGSADKEMLPQEFVFSADFASLKIFIAISLSMMRTASKQASTLPYYLPGRSCLDVKDLPTSS